MYDLFSKVAFQMELLKPYGLFHVAYFLIGLILSILIALKLKNISIKNLNKIIFGIGSILIISEIVKQLFYTIYINNGDYPLWIFPFQLCSVPMYLCMIIPFVKNKNIHKYLCLFLMSYNLLGGFISFFEPSGLINRYVLITAHSFIWHMLLVVLGFIVGFNKNLKKEKKDFKYVLIFYLILCVIAFSLNVLLGNLTGNNINMFFIGPAISPIIVFETIATKYGWFINDLLFIPLMSVGAYLFYLPFTKNLTKM